MDIGRPFIVYPIHMVEESADGFESYCGRNFYTEDLNKTNIIWNVTCKECILKYRKKQIIKEIGEI